MRTSIIVIAIVFLKVFEVHWNIGSIITFHYPLMAVTVFIGSILGLIMSFIQDIKEIINNQNN